MKTYKKIYMWIGKNKVKYLTPKQFESLFDVSDCNFKNAHISCDDSTFSWYNGTWENGVFKGKWYGGFWKDGVWEGIVWEKSRVYVPSLEKYIMSDVNPTETLKKYSQGFSKDISKLKQNNISLPKEIRFIKDPTLYSIADMLVRI